MLTLFTSVNTVHIKEELMGATIQKRVTGQMAGEFVVFLIGMRVNRWWKVWQWLRVSRAMARMLRELEGHPQLGFLGGESWLGRTTILMSYWRSTEELIAYARSRKHEHLPAWRAFNRLIGTSGDVGVWHETYRVRPGDYETVYVNMPAFGAGKVGKLLDAHGAHEQAAGRLAAGRRSTAPTPGEPRADATAADTPATDAPTRDASTRDASTRDASTRDASATDAPTRDAPTRGASAGDAPAGGAPTRDAPAGDAPLVEESAARAGQG
jgi:hypothetical protein